MLAKGQVQIMYQTYSSLEKDMPNALKHFDNAPSQSMVYVKISSIDWIEKHLDGVDVIVPKRVTLYGSTEICVREPAGNLVTFAAFKDSQAGESNF